MIDHRTAKIWINLYLDDELAGDELVQFKQHIAQCDECAKILAQQRNFIDSIKLLKYDFPISDGLRDFQDELIEKINRYKLRKRTIFLYIFPAIALLIVLGVLFLYRSERSEFTMIAVENHLRQVRGQLPLEIETSSEAEISNWFEGKLKFNFRLPKYPDPSNQPYKIKGARLVALNNDYAGLVSYEMNNKPMTLLVASSSSASPYGKTKIKFKNINFYLDSKDGVNILSWTDKGLTYALVFDFENFDWKKPCIVCHSNASKEM